MRGYGGACCVAALLASFASASLAAPAARVPFEAQSFAAPPTTLDASISGDRFLVHGADAFGAISLSGELNQPIGFAGVNGPPAPHERFEALSDVSAEVPVAPNASLEFGYRLDNIAPLVTGLGAQDSGLVLANTSRGAEYAPFGNADYVGATLKLAPSVSLHVGEANSNLDRNEANENAFATLSRPVDALLNLGQRTANSLMAGVTLKAADWGGVDLTASHTDARFGVIDSAPISSLSSNAINVSAELKFGSGWVTSASYGQSLSKLDIKPSALSLSSTDELQRSGYAVSIAKHGIFGDDALGLSVSRPVDPEISSAGFAGAVSYASPPNFTGPDHLLGEAKSETDVELGYSTSFSDSFALQTNAAYDMNFQGQSGVNALQFFSRAKIKF